MHNRVCVAILLLEDLIKLLLAILFGGLIGTEREFRDKSAGFRTIIFICVGATLFTMFSLKLGGNAIAIAGYIVSGVGFLGAGAIFRGTERISGLTTASTIWVAAALGIGIGAGFFVESGVAVGLVLLILLAFPRIEAWIDSLRDVRTYEVVCPVTPDNFLELEQQFVDSGLKVSTHKQAKSGEDMICKWTVFGRPEAHEQLIKKLLARPEVKEFRF